MSLYDNPTPEERREMLFSMGLTERGTELIDAAIESNTPDRAQTIIDLMSEDLRSQLVEGQGYEGALQNQPIQNLIDRLGDSETMVTLRSLDDLKTSNPTAYARIVGGTDDTALLYKTYRNAVGKYEEGVTPAKTQEEVSNEAQQLLTDQITGNTSNNYYIPTAGIQQSYSSSSSAPTQSNPLLKLYSPRLFGAPPQLTNMCDMRLLSAYDDSHYGPVGDYYLQKILQDAPICNFFVGRARFTGGVGSVWGILNQTKNYLKALNTYDIYGKDDTSVPGLSETTVMEKVVNQEAAFDAFSIEIGEDADDFAMTKASDLGLEGVDADVEVANITGETRSMLDSIGDSVLGGAAGITASLLTSLSVQQPFYTFEADWYTYINNVKMMINTAVIMLGLQKAPVRIGEQLFPVGMNANVSDKGDDVWSNYRYITPTDGLGAVTQRDNIEGDTSQYVSLMVDPNSFNETYTNNVGDSQLFGIMNQGQSFGNEIAFLTNASTTKADDIIINLAQKGTNAAEAVMSTLGGGIGRFTAAIVGGFTKSFTGDHTIYPQIFQSSSSQQTVSFTTHLVSPSGDPYSYLINVLVPLFYLMGMALPRLSKNNAAAYAFPPIIQANVPGLWGTRLGMITSLSVTKNPGQTDVSINGYPLAIDVQITVTDLQHVLMTSPMNEISTFLNNNTMFDYIAQMCGCDKYRVNPAVRLVTKLALTSSALRHTFDNIGDSIMAGANTWMNRKFGYSQV